jgi:hypothetical protein
MSYKYIVGLSFLFAFGASYVQAASSSLPKTKEEVLNAGLPVVEITTVNGELPTCEHISGKAWGISVTSITNATKVPGRLTISTKKNGVIYDSGDYEQDMSGMTFKIRGNTSALVDKKPYKIKLQKKGDLLCRGDKKYKNKNWLLIHDYKYRAILGFKVNELMGMQWTPAHEYVNVMINGKYQGLYLLLESVERDVDCRINVSKSGYLFEYDAYWWKEDLKENGYYVKIPTYLSGKMYYTFKYPDTDDMTDDQKEYFIEMITAVEASVKDGTYQDYIDISSFASWVLAHDILGTADGTGSNIFLTKYDNTKESKVMMANLWDFDSILQKTKEWSTSHKRFYFPHLFSKNPNNAFIKAYRNRWDDVSPIIFDELNSYLDAFAKSKEADALNTSVGWDDELWKWESKTATVQDLMTLYKSKFDNRKAWLADAISTFPSSQTKGDVNGDTYVDKQDIMVLKDIIKKKRLIYQLSRVDVNGDKKVNVADIVELIKLIRKK